MAKEKSTSAKAKKTTTKKAVVKKVVTKKKPLKKTITKKYLSTELHKHDFRVTIFGSARIKKEDKLYKQVFQLAEEIGKEKIDIVTGGGPGLMAAGNAGHQNGDKNHEADSIGLIIKLPFEAKSNKHLEIKKEFEKFSDRLDTFMALSHAIVVMPGGVGTCLELFYTWQLIQVGHMSPLPIILVGKMWTKLMKWIKKYPVKDGLISPEDMKNVYVVKNNKQAMKIIRKTRDMYEKDRINYWKKLKKYKLD
ncbi:hypothetical protein COU74_01500 [Candidatus Peregrinibacteria bacterium CG10_big_fil_rev_8_21_14_0_10_36_19]|nr:MAG: hypothetical protein COU74_01500 [Candidatus Peregrinibacteria bacterium CG10_big_fil_rev_8_21_14_0_10_36_19]